MICLCLTRRREVMTSQKLKLWNYGIGWHIKKEQDEKCSIAKKKSVRANWRGDLRNVMLRWLHINSSKIGLDRKRFDPSQFSKDLCGVIRALKVRISPRQFAIKGWFFCKGASFILFALNMPSNTIILQIWILWRHTSLIYCFVFMN